MNSHVFVGAAVIGMGVSSAMATITGNAVFGDAYLVVDGAKTYSVLDVYLKSNKSTDILANVYGVSTYKASWQQVATGTSTTALNFKHAGNSSWNANYTDAAGAGWDSFVTLGLRNQSNDGYGGTAIGLTADPGFSNMNSSNAGKITGATTQNGPGWYSAAGATVASNPNCVFGFYNGQTGAINTAKNTNSANGIAAGSSLDNMFMIARLAIDTSEMVAGSTYTLAAKFCMTGVSDGSNVAGSTSSSFRVNQSLTFAAVPGPGALAAIGLAGFLRRRRSA